jgi:DNA-binding response OmpR family regulator
VKWYEIAEKHMQILIVDDDSQVTYYIMRRLAGWGYASQSANTGAEALEKIVNEKFELIILDIMLPDFKGYDLIPKFKSIQPDVGIITMTGHNSRDLEQKIRNQGILYYMVKPIETKNLKLLLEFYKNKSLS